MECDFAISLPYQLRLQDNTGIVEDLKEQYSRTLGTTRQDFRITQISAGVENLSSECMEGFMVALISFF
jgi:hypothetical protein